MKYHVRGMVVWLLLVSVAATACGCASLAQKFRRKPKKEEQVVERVLIAPEKYAKVVVSPAEEYQEKYLYGKVSLDEFIDELEANDRNKKWMLDLLSQATQNLAVMRDLLQGERKQFAGACLNELQKFTAMVDADQVAPAQVYSFLRRAERLRRDYIKKLSYNVARSQLP